MKFLIQFWRGRIPKGFRPSAQGCEGGKSSLDRATLGYVASDSSTMKGLRRLQVVGFGLLLVGGLLGSLFLNSALAAKKATTHLENDPAFTTVLNRVNVAFEKSWQQADL